MRLHWEEDGAGRAVVLAGFFYGSPEMLDGLRAELSRDHRVVSYHLRGTGRSSRTGPYDPLTDAADLDALVEALGEPVVIVAFGDGILRAARVGSRKAELVRAVVASGVVPFGPYPAPDTEALVASAPVLRALVALFERDYRAGVRTIVDIANPGLSAAETRERVDRIVEHCPREAAVPRLRAWIGDAATDEAVTLGERLWLLHYPGNPWFAEDLMESVPQLVPEARLVAVEDGAMTRPDLTAAVVRRIAED